MRNSLQMASPATSAKPLPDLQLVKRTSPVIQDERGNADANKDFQYMLSAYSSSGGLANGEEFAQLLQERHRGDYMLLARTIASGEIFSFEWNKTVWIPMFQFDPIDLHIRRGPRQVFAELEQVFDRWALSLWFVQPNSWLNDRVPVELINRDIGSVLHAARADRFIAKG